jgi:hypothetical protein
MDGALVLSAQKGLPWDSWQDPPKQIEEEYERNNKDMHKN